MKNSETSSQKMTSTIAQIIVVVGGPSGIHYTVQNMLVDIFQDAHYEVVKVAMPGGLQHTNVVLANLLMAYDRGTLLTDLQDMILLGPQHYGDWRTRARKNMEDFRNQQFKPRVEGARMKAPPASPPNHLRFNSLRIGQSVAAFETFAEFFPMTSHTIFFSNRFAQIP